MAKKQIYISESPAKTKRLGRLLAKEILKSKLGKAARVFALCGDLGAGKTNFAQGLARGLGVKGVVNSPTFTIAKIYSLPAKSGFENFYHIDCYRLNSGDDLAVLNIKDVFADPRNIAVIEWPRVAAKILPKTVMTINFGITGKNSRQIIFDF